MGLLEEISSEELEQRRGAGDIARYAAVDPEKLGATKWRVAEEPEKAPEKEFDFDVSEHMQATYGAKLKGINSAGLPEFEDSKGEIYEVNPQELLKGMGEDVSNFDIAINSPDTALPISPVSAKDRALLRLGNSAVNETGKVKFLEQNYGQVFPHPEKGLLIKKDGAWHELDPDFFKGNDPYKATAQIMKGFGKAAEMGVKGFTKQYTSVGQYWNDIKDMASTFVEGGKMAAKSVGSGIQSTLEGNFQDLPGDLAEAATGAPQVALEAIGARLGGAKGAGIAGGLAKGVYTSLGRLAGTYEASPQEQLMDIGIESVINWGGDHVAAGVRPAMQQFWNGIKKTARIPNEVSKNIAKGFISQVSAGGRDEAVDHIFDPKNIGRVSNIIESNIPEGSDVSRGMLAIAQKNVKTVNKFVEEATQRLPQQFGRILDEKLYKNPAISKLDVNFGTKSNDILGALQEQGMGHVVRNKQGHIVDFDFFTSEADAAYRKKLNLPAEVFSKENAGKLSALVRKIADKRHLGEMKGPAAAKELANWNKEINGIAQELRGDATNATFNRIVSMLDGQTKQTIDSTLQKADPSLLAGFNEAKKLYVDYGNAVNFGRQALSDPQKMEVFLKQITATKSKGVKQVNKNTYAQQMEELLGKRGEVYTRRIADLYAAETFSPVKSRMSLGQGIATGVGLGTAAGLSTVSPAVGTAMTIAAIPATMIQSQPRTALREAQMAASIAPYAKKMGDVFKMLGPKEMDMLLNNPQAFSAVFRETLSGAAQEEQLFQDIMGQAEGALNGQ